MEPLVSICCITYNQENFIEETLAGFLKQQTSFPIEILIHDDASNDRTPSILKEYEKEDPRISVIYQDVNQYSQGKKPFLNFLFPKARGKYIALCEGDDYWVDPYKLQKQVDFLENNSQFVVTYHDAVIIDDKGNLIKKSKLPDNKKMDFSSIELQKGAFILTLTMCFRNVIKEIPEEIFRAPNGDTFLISLLGNFGSGKYLEVEPASYRIHEGGIWSSSKKEKLLLAKKNTFKMLETYHLKNNNREITSFFTTKHQNVTKMLVVYYIKKRNFYRAVIYFNKLLKMWF